MADITVKDVPIQIAQKFQKTSQVSYKDLIDAYESEWWEDFAVDMDIQSFYTMVKQYDGTKVA